MYPNLLAEMSRAGITSERIAVAISVNPSTMSAKLNNKERLKLAEAAAIRDSFFPSMAIDYLFSPEPMAPMYIKQAG